MVKTTGMGRREVGRGSFEYSICFSSFFFSVSVFVGFLPISHRPSEGR